MNIINESKMTDEQRRQELYRGSVFIYSPSPAALKFCDFARDMVETAFPANDPRRIQEKIPVEQCVDVLADLKPKFIHHQQSKNLIRDLLFERGCDLNKTYFDVPRMRTAFPSDYLTSGIAYAFQPHRDTWYSAPFSQINWWLPIYDVCPENVMAFHPRYWSEAVSNSSSSYNYYEWNRTNRQNAAQHIKTDTRVQPQALASLEPDPQLRITANAGGLILFSAAQLHSTVPNTSGVTRYSIDFRTVHLDDLWKKCGAPNVDSASTGTTLRDYVSAADFTKIPEDAVSLYFDGTEVDFVPSPSSATLTGKQK